MDTICLTFGGAIDEQVRAEVTGYMTRNTTPKISFEEWNGDRLAQVVLDGILREELLPAPQRSHLRKAAAMVEEPDIATAATLLAFMPELGAMSARQAASLVGVAPFDCESGAFRVKRRIAGGRKPPRDALYMAALVASRRNTTMAAAYHNLKNAGKPAKVALVAIMRKLITALNAMIRNKQQWAAA